MQYILIADSGSTKTDWCLVKDGQQQARQEKRVYKRAAILSEHGREHLRVDIAYHIHLLVANGEGECPKHNGKEVAYHEKEEGVNPEHFKKHAPLLFTFNIYNPSEQG